MRRYNNRLSYQQCDYVLLREQNAVIDNDCGRDLNGCISVDDAVEALLLLHY